MKYSLWNLCAQTEAGELLDALGRSGFAVRTVDTAGITSAKEFIDRCGETFGFRSSGWDSFADALLNGGLDTLLHTMDMLIRTGRAAYADDTEIITFLLGNGPNSGPVEIDDLYPVHD